MKKLNFIQFVICSTCLLLAGCNNQPVDSIEQDNTPESVVEAFKLDSLAPSEDELRELFNSSKLKQKRQGDIAHYVFKVSLGPNPYDIIRIHRVVRESRRFHPLPTRGAVFMMPGSGQTFDDIFLVAGSENPSAKTSAALYLASHKIDVWGIDFVWTQVPDGLDDYSFMQDWDIERDVDHALAAMSIVRFIRGLTRQGFGRVNLLGYSYGANVAYAAAGRETQQHRFLRDIRGIIPVDASFKVDDENRRLSACNNAKMNRGRLSAGVYRTDTGGPALISQLATTAPDDPSPIFQGFTNFQAALFLGTNPGALWHFVGVDFNESGLPVGLLYTDPDRLIRLIGTGGGMSVRASLDVGTTICNEEDVSIDDYLAEISVPILYLGAAGGFGTTGYYTTALTASEDVTLHTVSLQPENQRNIDFGHADLFLADDAPDLVWSVIKDWLTDHNSRTHRPDRKD